MKTTILCGNGQPVRVRFGKNISGKLLQNLGYSHALPHARYDILPTHSNLVRLVKIYRYPDSGSCDMTFWDASLTPLHAGGLDCVPEEREMHRWCAKSMDRLIGQAIFEAKLIAREDYSDDMLIF